MPRPAARLFCVALPLLASLAATPAWPARVLPLPEVDTTSGDSGSVAPDPARKRALPTRRLVFSCVSPGLVTFSDRPCGPLQEIRELTLTTPLPRAVGAPPKVGKDKAASTAQAASARDLEGANNAAKQHAETCKKLDAALDALDSHMRTGYTAREAGRLWDRWREAKARLREADC